MPPLARIVALLSGAVLATTCATVVEGERFPSIEPDPRYDTLYPYYVELCAVSQIRAEFGEHGSSPGHAAMYIKGACRDPQTEFPTLKVCGEGVDLADPESGHGVSVNKMLRNVNWVAFPGKQLFFHGNLGPDEVLDVDNGIAAIEDADRLGAFEGVEAHGSYLPPEDDEEALLYLLAAETLGTDFALDFGRTVWCSRLPLERDGLADLIEYLNGLNREYALGEVDYNWSGYNDNCSHTLHNALAAAGVWKSKSIRSYKLGQIANLSVPANEYADLALLTTTFELDDFGKIYRDPALRASLLERGWLPTRHGALVTYLPAHEPNDLYDTQTRIFMLKHPLRRAKSEAVGELYNDVRFTDLKANLLHFRVVYENILFARPEGWDEERPNDARHMARAAYYRYIEAQLADVKAKLRRLRSMPRPESPLAGAFR